MTDYGTFQYKKGDLSDKQDKNVTNNQPTANNDSTPSKNESKGFTTNIPKENSDITYRKHMEMIAKEIESSSGKDKEEMLEELRRQLKEKFFSELAIQKEMENVAFRLFFYPSVALSQKIQSKIGVEAETVIRNCVTLRHGDLELIKLSLDTALQKEIEHIMDDLVGWGPYSIDLKKLEEMSTNKIGSSIDKTYFVDEMNIEMRITPEQIVVKYKNKEVSPSQMKNKILREMALERLKRKATTVFYEVLAKNNFII